MWISFSECELTCRDLSPAILLHVFSPIRVDSLHVAVQHVVVVAVHGVPANRDLAAAAENDVFHSYFGEGLAEVADQDADPGLEVLEVVLVFPEGCGDLLGGAGDALVIDEVGQEFLGLSAAEHQGFALPEHFEVAEALYFEQFPGLLLFLRRLLFRGVLFDQVVQLFSHALCGDGLEDVTVHVEAEGIYRVLGVGGDKDDLRLRAESLQGHCEVQSAHAGHLDIAEYDVRVLFRVSYVPESVVCAAESRDLGLRNHFLYCVDRASQRDRFVVEYVYDHMNSLNVLKGVRIDPS